MKRKPLLTALLPIAIFLTLILPTPACDKHKHFNAASYNSRPQQHMTTSDNAATLTVGIIAGIVVASIALIVIIVLLILCITKRCPHRSTPYQAFADWRNDRNLTSVEIDRRNIGKPVRNDSSSATDHVDHARVNGFETI